MATLTSHTTSLASIKTVKEAADEAERLAGEAADSAEAAAGSAAEAAGSASAAATSASDAASSASQAAQDATAANDAANGALTGLSTVQDVVGTLNWLTEHGTYEASSDTEAVKGKFYWTVNTVSSPSGNPRALYYYEKDSNNRYTLTKDTTVVSGKTYYKLTQVDPVPDGADPSALGYIQLVSIDEGVSQYVSTHLALTDEGLYVLGDDEGWKVLIRSDGVFIYDPTGVARAKYSYEAVIGRESAERVVINPSATQFFDKDSSMVAEIAQAGTVQKRINQAFPDAISMTPTLNITRALTAIPESNISVVGEIEVPAGSLAVVIPFNGTLDYTQDSICVDNDIIMAYKTADNSVDIEYTGDPGYQYTQYNIRGPIVVTPDSPYIHDLPDSVIDFPGSNIEIKIAISSPVTLRFTSGVAEVLPVRMGRTVAQCDYDGAKTITITNELTENIEFSLAVRHAIYYTAIVNTSMQYTTTSSAPYYTFGTRNSGQGIFSMGIGEEVIPTGARSMAVGKETVATGANSVALGESTTALDDNSLAIGYHNNSMFHGPFSIGNGYTDSNGVLWENDIFNIDWDGEIRSWSPKQTLTGTSSTAAGTTTKTVTCSGYELLKGNVIRITFTNATTTSTSLNVNDTGAKQAYYNGARITSSNGAWAAGETVDFYYDGTYYQRIHSGSPGYAQLAAAIMSLGWASDVIE